VLFQGKVAHQVTLFHHFDRLGIGAMKIANLRIAKPKMTRIHELEKEVVITSLSDELVIVTVPETTR
jgi:hypothetical protein